MNEAERLAEELGFAGRYGTETEEMAAKRRIKRNQEAAAELRRLVAINAELVEQNKNLRTVAKKYIGWVGISEPNSFLEIDLKEHEIIAKAKQ